MDTDENYYTQVSYNEPVNCNKKIWNWICYHRVLVTGMMWITFEIWVFITLLVKGTSIDCNFSEMLKRMFLALSNLAIIPSILYCVWLNPTNLFMEIVIFSSLNMVSTFTHMCANNAPPCPDVCIMRNSILVYMDFTFSFHIIPTLVLYNVKPLNLPPQIKGGLHIFSLFINGILAFYFRQDDKLDVYFTITGIFVISVLLFRVLYLYQNKRLAEYITNHCNWSSLAISVIFAIAGISCKIIGDTNSHPYWLFHSLWHLLIMTSIFFTLNIWDNRIKFSCK